MKDSEQLPQKFRLGVKSDPIQYRYSYDWLFRLMAEEDVHHLQLGTFFEMYDLPDAFFHELRAKARDAGIEISSVFTAHRELGGFFRDDGPGWEGVALLRFRRLIEIAGILGARHAGSNPGAVLRNRMDSKGAGLATYVKNFKELMVYAVDRGVEWLTVEPMSCLAEPPTLPLEMAELMRELDAYHAGRAGCTARPGYCVDVAHGYVDAGGSVICDHLELMRAALPWTCELHLKNTDSSYDSTFGFGHSDRERGIIEVATVREFYATHAGQLPVNGLVGYLEISGPKLGRDYSDSCLETMLRDSLRHLRDAWLGEAPAVGGDSQPVQIAPSMMCVDQLNFQAAVRNVEAIGVDMLHIDIMDGQFVPNMPVGLGMVEQLAKRTRLPLDLHLMVHDNEFFINLLAGTRPGRVSVHVESCAHLDRTLSLIGELGAAVGVAINPGTSLDVLDYVLERIDYVLLMTVNPGFAGQRMTPASIRKIADCRRRLNDRGYPNVSIQVDGNVSFQNIAAMVAAGADCLVAGTSSIFHTGATWAANLRQTRESIAAGLLRRQAMVEASETIGTAG
jgi:ribulose-phosphate 3-epimerase